MTKLAINAFRSNEVDLNACNYDTWFRHRVAEALKVADDPATQWIDEAEWQIIRENKMRERDAMMKSLQA